MAINFDTAGIPVLKINEEFNVVDTDEIVYLGDVFNEKGNNDGLIKDRVKRGTKAMVTVSSLIAENEVGIHKMSVLLLLYQSLFISTVLFNSQTWSKLRHDDVDKLEVMQLKYLKRAVGVAASAPNSFVYLELGVLPIGAEIEKRQLMYLYRILNLDESDPVYQMRSNMALYGEAGEKNWWTQVEIILEKYNITKNLSSLKKLSKEQYKSMIHKKVMGKALEDLIEEYQSLKKCQNMTYTSLQLQEYLKVLYPSQARIIFMCRCKMLDIKTHRTHKYKDTLCRGCGIEEETISHIVNCGMPEGDHIVNPLEIGELSSEINKSQLINVVNRIDAFLGSV